MRVGKTCRSSQPHPPNPFSSRLETAASVVHTVVLSSDMVWLYILIKSVGRSSVNQWSGERLAAVAGVEVVTSGMQVSVRRGTEECRHPTSPQSKVLSVCTVLPRC